MADSNEPTPRLSGAGGTEGGLGMFLMGLFLVIVGVYLLTNQVSVTTSFWHVGGYSAFGITLIPLLIGIGMLFFNGESVIGWILTVVGSLIIIVGIIANMDIYFRSTTLFNTILILGMLAGGIGLIARAIRPVR